VKVYRLVLRGTIEELKYLRQVYKTQLQSGTIVDVGDSDREKASRLFRGVAGDGSRKGELFGLENLLKFKDGTFMPYATRMSESKQFGVGVCDRESLLETVKGLTEDQLEAIGEDVDQFAALAQNAVGKCVQKATSSLGYRAS
jgi:DNA excision repair protein ERCC-6-like 2